MRRVIGFLFGVLMMIAGLSGSIYMVVHDGIDVGLKIWAVPISLFAIGGAIVVEDIIDFFRRSKG